VPWIVGIGTVGQPLIRDPLELYGCGHDVSAKLQHSFEEKETDQDTNADQP
jgi:hypothetical protein